MIEESDIRPGDLPKLDCHVCFSSYHADGAPAARKGRRRRWRRQVQVGNDTDEATHGRGDRDECFALKHLNIKLLSYYHVLYRLITRRCSGTSVGVTCGAAESHIESG
jgi:hypothetical protein